MQSVDVMAEAILETMTSYLRGSGSIMRIAHFSQRKIHLKLIKISCFVSHRMCNKARCSGNSHIHFGVDPLKIG
jgi:hypothetical protein